jgi:hypothetical protein
VLAINAPLGSLTVTGLPFPPVVGFEGAVLGHRQRTQQSRPDSDHRKHHRKHHEDLPLRQRHVAGSWSARSGWIGLVHHGNVPRMNLHDSIRDIGIGVGGPAGGLLVANIVPDPTIANASVVLGSLAALTVIIKNLLDIYHNHFK